MESGVCSGNYFNYASDAEARLAERRKIDGLAGKFIDLDFPSDARAVYFDPYSTPKGQIPASQLKWFRISDKTVRECTSPVVIVGDAMSANVDPGTLADKYFVNALRVIGCRASLVNRLIVSSEFAAEKGIYTVKFFKMGRWRYVHVDDFIACRPSGKVNFCRNKNPDEVFAMIIEKAYAKLHGCYEAIAFGLTEFALQDFTYGGHIDCFRNEVDRKLMGATAASDRLWEAMTQIKYPLWGEDGELMYEKDETGVIGCMRAIPDGFTEPPQIRRGIALGVIYEVVDACIAYAAPTETMDSLTVGMVLVRNINVTTGRFNGRWSLGNILWKQYPEISHNLRERTLKYLVQRGDVKRIKIKQAKKVDPRAKKKPPKKKKNSMFDIPDDMSAGGSSVKSGMDSVGSGGEGGGADINNNSSKKKAKEVVEDDDVEYEIVDGISDPYGQKLLNQLKDGNRLDLDLYWDADPRLLEEIDDPESVFPLDMPSIKDPQPIAADLFWIQIEDFVDIFNRIYTINDFSLEPNSNCQIKTYLSRWIPGDYAAGSGGPPMTDGGAALDANKTMTFEMLSEEDALKDLFLLRDKLNQEDQEEEEEDDGKNPFQQQLEGASATGDKGEGAGTETAAATTTSANGNANGNGASSLAGGGSHAQDTKTATVTDSLTEVEPGNLKNPASKMETFGEDSTYVGSVGSVKEYSMYDLLASSKQKVTDADNSIFRRINYLPNPSFIENPMIPFELFYDSQIIITLSQRDRRWGLDRFLTPITIRQREGYANRHETLLSCLRYKYGIGFVIVKLYKNNTRISQWKADKMVGKSEGIKYSQSVSGFFNLAKGRYAVVPFQSEISNVAMDYMLSFHFDSSATTGDSICRFHFKNDIVGESAVDCIQSDSDCGEEDDGGGYGGGDGSQLGGDDSSSIKLNANGIPDFATVPPMPLVIPDWEFNELVEEIGVRTMYEEVGALASTMSTIHMELQAFKDYLKMKRDELAALKDEELRRIAIAEAKAAKKGLRRAPSASAAGGGN